MKGTERQKPPPWLVLEAEEAWLWLASHSLTDKATSWFPLLPEFSAIALDTRREEGTEVKEQRNEIAQFWQRTPGGTTPIYWYKKIQKERERERERERMDFLGK
jgi:hypothetical protein